MSIDPNIESDYLLATPDKTIVNAGGKPIKKPKNTTTTEGKQDKAPLKLLMQMPTSSNDGSLIQRPSRLRRRDGQGVAATRSWRRRATSEAWKETTGNSSRHTGISVTCR